jgi:hypothetical protein
MFDAGQDRARTLAAVVASKALRIRARVPQASAMRGEIAIVTASKALAPAAMVAALKSLLRVSPLMA